jgi:iron complex transport system ATP-binding protein
VIASLTTVSAGYGREPVLSDITLSLAAGECVAIVGPNGSGKSTLLKTIAGLVTPTAGTIALDGRGTISPRERARAVAYSRHDDAAEWPLTVGQTVRLGRAPHRGWVMPFTADDDAIAADVMQKCGIADFADRPVDRLSDGERQRVTLARALAQQPKLLLLDEPTANLDLKYQVELLSLVKGWASCGLAVAAAIHDLTLAAGWADRVVLLKRGRVVASGTPAACFTEAWLGETFETAVRVHAIDGRLVVVPGKEIESKRARG